MVAKGRWDLTGRLRGQLIKKKGINCEMPGSNSGQNLKYKENVQMFVSSVSVSCVVQNLEMSDVNIQITLVINQQMHYIKFHIKTLKIAPTCFDPKIILRELRCSLLKPF